MVEKTTGLILRVFPLTESSLIVDWLTADFGRISTVAKGARRTKSPFRGKLDLFYLADLTFARSARSDLHTLREVQLRETHNALRTDIHALQQAAYCARLLIQATEKETPLPGLFDLLTVAVREIASAPPRSETILAFEAKLLTELGLAPDRPEAARLAAVDWPAIREARLTEPERTQLVRFLKSFIIYHLGKLPGGRDQCLDT